MFFMNLFLPSEIFKFASLNMLPRTVVGGVIYQGFRCAPPLVTKMLPLRG